MRHLAALERFWNVANESEVQVEQSVEIEVVERVVETKREIPVVVIRQVFVVLGAEVGNPTERAIRRVTCFAPPRTASGGQIAFAPRADPGKSSLSHAPPPLRRQRAGSAEIVATFGRRRNASLTQ